MTKKDFEETKKALRSTRVKATRSKKAALELLKAMGMVDNDGKLTPHYNRKNAA